MQRKNVNRIMVLFIAMIVFTVSIPIDVHATNAAKSLPALTGNQGQDAAQIAASQIGYSAGTNKDNIYAKELGGINYANWCAYFVTWCAKKAGLASTNYPSLSEFGSVTKIFKWFKERGRWHRKNGTSWNYNGITDNSSVDSNYTPNAGDLVLFETSRYSDGPDHIGMVESVSNGTLIYIHGNTSGGSGTSTVKRASCSLTSSIIWGYCSPAYAGSSNSNKLPNGVLDSATGGAGNVYVRGWAFDSDTPSKQLQVHVYIGGPAGTSGVEGYSITANKYRPDVNAVYGTGNYHGFEEIISVNKTGTQEVYVYAIDGNVDGNRLLNHYTVYIKKQNEINFLSSTVTVNEGESKAISFSFQGEGIHSLAFGHSNNNISPAWGSANWATGIATITVKGLKAGTTALDICFLDSDKNEFYKDTLTVKVNHVHKYTTAKVTKQPTCTTTGTRSYVCSCGAVSSSTETIPATGHTIVNDAAVAATCTTSGKTAGSHCSVCNAVIVQQKTIPATGHKGGTASCNAYAKCSVCGISYGGILAHNFSTQWTIDVQPTCTTSGIKSHHCIHCGIKKDETVIPATGHQGGTATCTSKAKCCVCGVSYGNYESHDYSISWTIDQKATCTTAGSKSQHCKNCSARTNVTTIPATGHTGGTATCSQQAKCTTCGTAYGYATGHSFSSQWTIDKPATCVSTGSKSYHCYYCDAKKNVTSTPATGHQGGTATCTEQAKCSVCGVSYGNYASHEYVNGTCSYCKKTDGTQTDNVTDSKTENNNSNITTDDVTNGAVTESGDTDTADNGKNDITTNNTGNTNEVNGTAEKEDTSTELEQECDSITSDYEEETLYSEVGDVLEDATTGHTYEITSNSASNRTVEYLGIDKNASTVVIPNAITINGVTYKVTSVAEGAFERNTKITKVVIGKNVTKIGAEAFSGCKNLKNVTMGDNVTQIGAKAFYNCKKLTKITIPAKVNKIGKSAFYGCRKLKSITIKTTKLTSGKVGAKAFKYIYSKAKVTVPEGKVKAYKKLLRSKGASSKIKVK